ncbi:MAG TPA: D-alanine--D-alanine ligase [Candidatus Marinimicrobia bacterium]|nr:D-alanine--D-alanine ligase [Candidatus Neomarinimicrobiota bacterium]HRS52148.1 D-alanine--D-alanine ligase [Candidatus Neomarinimicrobiota bacterium]HRU92475.1 D-alanine--D-alanine ligase [Candidatus Neomarinimicrobiota bacterium]
MSPEPQKIKIQVVFNDLKSLASNSDLDIISEIAVKDEAEAVYTALDNFGYVVEMLPIFDIDEALRKIDSFQPDVIFNLCEGWQSRTDQEMNVAGLWEMLDLPYTGNSPLTLGLAQNKILSKNIFRAAGIPTPDFCVFESVPDVCDLEFPLIAKPSREDGSVGITQNSVVNNLIDLKSVVEYLLVKYKQPILVEKYIAGREFNVSILGNDNPQVLPPSEINFEQVTEEYFPITSYEAKWLSNHPIYKMTPPVCPASIGTELAEKLANLTLAVYHALRGRDYGRVDIRMDASGDLFVLEYNPNPDISLEAGFVRALKAADISYEYFIDFLVKQALNRRSK